MWKFCFHQFVGLAKLLRKMISLSLVYENITTFSRRSQLDIIKVIYTPFDFTNLIIACILQYVAQKILENEHHHWIPGKKLYRKLALHSYRSGFIINSYNKTSFKVQIQSLIRGLQNTVPRGMWKYVANDSLWQELSNGI